MLWPRGFSASFDPVRLYGADGRVIAEAGERLTMSGGYGPNPEMERCRLGSSEVARVRDVQLAGEQGSP